MWVICHHYVLNQWVSRGNSATFLDTYIHNKSTIKACFDTIEEIDYGLKII